MENNFVLSPSLFSSIFLELSLSYKHTLTQSHAHTHNNSLSTLCGVTNFSWALDFGMREGEKEKMKERGEAVLHCQLRGSRPHRRSLISPLISSFWLSVRLFCLRTSLSPEHPAWDSVNLITVYSPVSGTGDKSQAMCVVLPSVRRNWNLSVLFLHPIWAVFAGFCRVERLPISRALFTHCVLLTTGWYKYQLL